MKASSGASKNLCCPNRRGGLPTVPLRCAVVFGAPHRGGRCAQRFRHMSTAVATTSAASTSTRLVGLVATTLPLAILATRRGYAIMDKYKRIKPANEQAAGQVQGEPEERGRKKKRTPTIPLQYLRAEPPPEVTGIADTSMDDEGTEGKILEVSLLGAPNAGKSSLANALVQTKVCPRLIILHQYETHVKYLHRSRRLVRRHKRLGRKS